MKRWLRGGLVLALILSLLAGVIGQGVASAKSPKPQDQVKNFMSAAAGLKATKAAGYWVAEQRSNVSSQLAGVPSGTKISLSKLKLVVTSQTADTTEVSATYVIKIKPKGSKKTQQSNQSDTFTLTMVNGTWLISKSTIWEHLAGLVTTSTTTPTPTKQGTSSATPIPATTTPNPTTSGNPVKIGAINSWSGPTALSGVSIADPIIKLVEKQVKDTGGILGGRPAQVVRFDNRASVAEGQAGVKKLCYDDKVAAITMGGVSGAEFSAIAQACEEAQILFACIAHVEDLAKYKFTVNATVQSDVNRAVTLRFIKEVLKPKTAAYLGTDDSSAHSNMAFMSQQLEAAGTKTEYLEYCPIDTNDFSPYLTKIKYAKPDMLYLYSGSNEVNIAIAKQMMELGGWGNIKVVGLASAESAKNQPGAQGWYLFANWAPGIDYPGMTKFQNEYNAMFGKSPSATQIYYYNSLWTAIYAIKLAGTDTDRVAIAQAARSGNLEWDTPMGHAKFQPDGTSGLSLIIEQIVNKSPVYVFGP